MREGKIAPTDIQGASFTISSLGGIGGTNFTPIVNAPEMAILGVVRSTMKPVWDGKAFQPRLMLPLCVSYVSVSPRLRLISLDACWLRRRRFASPVATSSRAAARRAG